MGGVSDWLCSNWSTVVGAIGIIGSLVFTGTGLLADARQREISNLLALDDRHRELWGEVKQRHELRRILSRKVDLISEPPTPEEDVSMWQIIQQFETGWRVERILKRGELRFLARDAADFFSLPLPRAAWEKAKRFRHPQFVRFVETALEGDRR